MKPAHPPIAFLHSSFVILQSLALVASVGASGCASAPKVTAPVLSYEQKLARIIRLEDQRMLREPPPEPVNPPPTGRRGRAPALAPPPDLITLLGDPDARVRRRAALGIGRVGLPAGVPPLLPLLKDPDADIRQMAAFALGLIGDHAALAPLQALLTDVSQVVRGRAAEALGLIGDPSAAPAIAAMVREAAAAGAVAALKPDDEEWPADPGAEAFRLGIYALVRLKAYEPLSAATLTPAGQPISRWWPVAYALQRIEDPRAVPALMALARGEGRYTRAFAARGLGTTKAADAVEVLATMVDPASLDPLVAVSAVRALGQIGGQAAIDALMPLLTAPTLDSNVRLEAVTAIGGLRAAAAADPLMDLAGDPWPAMRAQALRALSLVDPNAFLFALSGLDPDRHWSVRASIATTLAGIDPAVAIPRVEAMLEDSDRRVVPAVLSALAQLKAPGLEEVVRKHLDDPDLVIRMTAARELGELQPADGVTLFSAAYHRWAADTTYVARAAALTALAKYGKAAVETLEEALGDREWAVRVRAFDLLKAIDPATDPQRIRPVPGTAPVSYDTPEMLAPQFSPHLYLETRQGLVEIELAVNEAPLTSQTIIMLAQKGFFTGIPFHRVVPNFVVQGGDPRGDGEGGPGFTLRDEINQLPYLRGAVGMALDWRDTGGSQFFITHSPQPHLDARYTVFGRVVNGMDVVDKLRQWDVIERVRVWDGVNLTGRQ
jgi:HEAT repeat protein/cyclophilin family peptidyl-prolyl cis-trans isomerase